MGRPGSNQVQVIGAGGRVVLPLYVQVDLPDKPFQMLWPLCLQLVRPWWLFMRMPSDYGSIQQGESPPGRAGFRASRP